MNQSFFNKLQEFCSPIMCLIFCSFVGSTFAGWNGHEQEVNGLNLTEVNTKASSLQKGLQNVAYFPGSHVRGKLGKAPKNIFSKPHPKRGVR